MKKFIAMIMCLVTLFCVFSVSALAASTEQITPYLNNPCETNSNFSIDSNGNARVLASYEGSANTVTGATIKIKIQKQFLFFFWTDVVEWIDESNDSYHTFVHSIQVDSGTYKATIEYTIRGTGGEPDVITDTIERSH